MALTVRKKRFVRRLLGYATNPAAVKARTLLNREQTHDIGGVRITLPPDHNLPFYQRRDPTYDAYAVALLRRLSGGERLTVIDVGANVGDTAAAVLAADPATQVISVEGNEDFLGYLRRNLAAYPERATVVAGFVGPVGERVAYRTQGSTGGFQPAVAEESDTQVQEWVSPAQLLQMVGQEDRVVWKSDIDGFDIHVLAEHWNVIDERCEAIWFEFDSPRTLGDRADVARLIELIAASGRTCWVYDNLGRRMVVLAPGEGQATALSALSEWLHEQIEGHITVPYLDVWAFRSDSAGRLGAETADLKT